MQSPISSQVAVRGRSPDRVHEVPVELDCRSALGEATKP
jgi:hypothetical protein